MSSSISSTSGSVCGASNKTLVNLTGVNIYLRAGADGMERVQVVPSGRLIIDGNDETSRARQETMQVRQSDRSTLLCRTYVTEGPHELGDLMVIPPGGRGMCVPFEPVLDHDYIVNNDVILMLLFAKQSETASKCMPIMSFLAPLYDIKDFGAASTNGLTFLRRFEI